MSVLPAATPVARAPTLLLLATLLVAPAASGHGLINLGIVVPAHCPGTGSCLTTVENQPRLHAGETVDLHLYNDDDELHEVFVTTNASADPQRSNTSTEGFLAQAGPVTANRSASGGELAVPRDAEALYVWCWIDDHEAEGEHLVIDLQAPHEQTDEVPGPGPEAGLAVLAAGLLLARRRRGG